MPALMELPSGKQDDRKQERIEKGKKIQKFYATEIFGRPPLDDVGMAGNDVIYDYSLRETMRTSGCGCPQDKEEARKWVKWTYEPFKHASDKDIDEFIQFLRKT